MARRVACPGPRGGVWAAWTMVARPGLRAGCLFGPRRISLLRTSGVTKGSPAICVGGMGVVCFAAVFALSFGAALVPRLLPLGLGQRLMASAGRLTTRSSTNFSLGVALVSAGHAEMLQGVAKTMGRQIDTPKRKQHIQKVV